MSAERLNLPARRAVIGGDGGHPLQREGFAHQVRPHVLLQTGGGDASPDIQLADDADRLDGLDLVDATLGLNVLVHQLVGGLCLRENAQTPNGHQHNHSVTHGSELLLYGTWKLGNETPLLYGKVDVLAKPW